MADPEGAALYRTIWRWHFYAGLFVLPFVLILSVTGSIYLFKPQIDRWEERAWRGLGTEGAVSHDVQLSAVLKTNPGLRFNSYRLPEDSGDAAAVELLLLPLFGASLVALLIVDGFVRRFGATPRTPPRAQGGRS